MEIGIEKIPDYSIAYMRRVGAYGIDNYKLMTKMKEWAKVNQLLNDTNILFGIAHDDERTKPEDCRYDVAVVIPEQYEADAQVKIGTITGGDYLIFKLPHTVEAIKHFWNNVLGIVEEKNCTIDYDKPILERYC